MPFNFSSNFQVAYELQRSFNDVPISQFQLKSLNCLINSMNVVQPVQASSKPCFWCLLSIRRLHQLLVWLALSCYGLNHVDFHSKLNCQYFIFKYSNSKWKEIRPPAEIMYLYQTRERNLETERAKLVKREKPLQATDTGRLSKGGIKWFAGKG